MPHRGCCLYSGMCGRSRMFLLRTIVYGAVGPLNQITFHKRDYRVA
jgi:hypothetical protein